MPTVMDWTQGGSAMSVDNVLYLSRRGAEKEAEG
jgi:hypothetical protein